MSKFYINNVPKKSQVTQRTCLNCRKMFKSSGPGNRICDKCSTANKNNRLENVYQVIAENKYVTESQY